MVFTPPVKTVVNLCTLIIIIVVPHNNALPSFVVFPGAQRPSNTAHRQHGSPPQRYDMKVNVDVINRFAITTVSTSIVNFENTAQETTFALVLPDAAFLSYFLMTVDSKRYLAHVKSKEDALGIYQKAVHNGHMAAIIDNNVRDSNLVTIRINMEPNSKASFDLVYEELLKRSQGRYEIVLNIFPGNPLKDLNVTVFIKDQQKISFVKTPGLRSGQEIGQFRDMHDPTLADITRNPYDATINFHPDILRQMRLANSLCTEIDEGLAGQFVVQYDVQRDPQGGDILLRDGYFVHFFAPSDRRPLPKHVVFILDTSSSMAGKKLQQLKEAMKKILDDLKPEDIFHLVEFNEFVKVWNLDYNYYDTTAFAKPASANYIHKAKGRVENFYAYGRTDIHGSLLKGLDLIQNQILHTNNYAHQPMIIFLTDGTPVGHVTNLNTINHDVEQANKNIKTPIYSLSFGDQADRKFLHTLSTNNFGFTRHIYENADASLQLQKFYSSISSPDLSNVQFSYDSGVEGVTKSLFPIFFNGSEIIIAGRTGKSNSIDFSQVSAKGPSGQLRFVPKVSQAVGSLERLWVYLTIKQKLDAIKANGRTSSKQEVLDLALKYSLVTPLSSYVVNSSSGASIINMGNLLSGTADKKKRKEGCSPNKFSCANNRTLIPKFLVCNGKDDCPDGSDETYCELQPNCNSRNMFQCVTSRDCVPSVLKCNGKKDCKDGSDEANCIFYPSRTIKAPIITMESNETIVDIQVQLHCVAVGNPRPTIKIVRTDGIPLNPKHTLKNGVLTIEKSVDSDHGTYSCIAENSVGRAMVEGTITVFENLLSK